MELGTSTLIYITKLMKSAGLDFDKGERRGYRKVLFLNC